MEIIKPPLDHKIYKSVHLNNGIETVIIYDKDSPICSATLVVNIGFSSDPKSIPGLAHFLEHMLFMGTKKYKNTNTFFDYMNKYGGNSNAMTSDEFTAYYFDIQAKYFSGALDIFFRFFTEPLFKEDTVSREMNAVDSENSKNKNFDMTRLDLLLKVVADQNHPFAKFGGGNLETLNVNNIRGELINFYDKYYSSNVIKLVVYTNEDLGSTEELVRNMFENIKDTKVDPEKNSLPFKTSTLIKFVPVSDTQILHIFWQLPDTREYYKFKPVEYIINMLGHESEGMLIHYLKHKLLLIDMSVAKYVELSSFTLVHCALTLTDEGFLNIPYILDLLYSYIETIRDNGINKNYYREMQKINKLNFDFLEAVDTSTTTTNVALNMLFFPTYDVLYGPYRYDEYTKETEKIIANMLKYFTRQNSIVAIASKLYEDPKYKIDQREYWYNTKYKAFKNASTFGPEFNQQHTHNIHKFSLPVKNMYIPKEVTLLQQLLHTKYPKRLPIKNLELWFKQDDKFNTPYVLIHVCLSSDYLLDSAKNNISVKLFIKLLEYKLSSDIYYASLANSVVALDIVDTFVTFFISCYNSNVEKLLNSIISAVHNFTFTKEDYKICFNDIETDLKNYIYQQPITLANEYFKEKVFNNYFTRCNLQCNF